MKFNINHIVRVRLTDLGRKLMIKNHNALFGNRAHLVEVRSPSEIDGWSELQLWYLMAEFGQHLNNGCDLPFETEIEIPERPDAES